MDVEGTNLVGRRFERGGLRAGRCRRPLAPFRTTPDSLRDPDRSNPSRRRCAMQLRGCRTLTSTRREPPERVAEVHRRELTANSFRYASTTSATMCEVCGQIGARSSALTSAMRAISMARLPCHSIMPRAVSSLTDPARAIPSTSLSSIGSSEVPGPIVTDVGSATCNPILRAHSRARDAAVVSLPPMTEIKRAAPSSV